MPSPSPALPADPPLLSGLPPVCAADARVLVLGSLPGSRSLQQRQYYAHPRNQFWHLLGGAIGCDLAGLDYPGRLAVLRQRRIALWDIVAEGRRKGSLDSAMQVERMQDVPGLIDGLDDLRMIACNGALAARLVARAPLPPDLAILTLPSSSAANTMPLAAKQAELNRIDPGQ